MRAGRCGLIFKTHRWRELTAAEVGHLDRRGAAPLRVCNRCGARGYVDNQGRVQPATWSLPWLP